MGHHRLNWLPKTKAWRLIVQELGEFALGSSDISLIARNTLQQVQKRFERLENDPSIKASFEFLVKLAYAFRQNDPVQYLIENKIIEKGELSAIKLAKAAQNYKPDEINSEEYETFAKQAAVDTINNWYAANLERGQSLFSEDIDGVAIMRKAADGRGFCEISRLFFSKYTERYLRYFLEREASNVITNLNERERFSDEIKNHVNEISKHAFETAYITQSYAAGWFNKYVGDTLPEDKQIIGFLTHALSKMKQELLHEEEK